MYKIRLADDTVIDNVELNGNNYIPRTLDKAMFVGNLSEVSIENKETGDMEILYNQKVQFTKIGKKETFILMDKSDKDILNEENQMRDNYLVDLDFRQSLVEMGVDVNDIHGL